jgi:LPXTG-motif cell wall-anchored protein
MNRIQISTVLFAAVFGIVAAAPKASADEWNKKTIVTISEPMEVPGAKLEPGKYVFKLADSQSDRHIVMIQNEREDKTYATILAIPNYRVQPTGTSRFLFWETPAGQPKALRAWFYPGDNFGQEFMYKPERRGTQITQATHQEAPAAPEAAAQPAPPPAPQEPVVVAQETPPPPPPPAAPVQAAPAPEPEPAVVAENNTPRELPQTGSNIPLLAMLGAFSVGIAFVLGAFAKRLG